jgi:DNA invertase Pin-like site-specific DNA recombinase
MRVSTVDQTIENQERDLKDVAKSRGWIIGKHRYADNALSGSKGRDKRPAYDAMLKAATRREFDLIASWSIDRLGRSVLHLAQLVNDLQSLGIGLYLHRQAIDSTTSSGRAMIGMCSVFAELEREIIRERIFAGIARAKAQGKHMGRPNTRTPLLCRQVLEIYKPNVRGSGIESTAKLLGLSNATVQRIVKAHI